MRQAIAIVALTYIATVGGADADERFPPVDHAATKSACGECHMVFQPQMLPRRSWQTLMQGLDRHFGEDASVPPPQAAEILAYLEANAADSTAGREGRKFLEGLGSAATPSRITETPYWVREHRKVEPATWKRPQIVTKSNCGACHTQAAQGDYDEDQIRIPR
jgi:hypothetical protein